MTDDSLPARHIEIIAHRGFSARAPENTLASIRAGLEAGADAVEWDMHVAACGTAVLIHDETLDRTTDGSGPVAERTFPQLRALDAGSWFHPEFARERIPSFREALEEVRPFGATVYAEVKGCRAPADLDRMARTVMEMGMEAQTVFISLDFGIVDHLSGESGRCRMGYVVDKHQRFQDAIRRARRVPGRSLVDVDYRMILEDPDLVPRARAQGVDVAVWTVNEPAEAETLARVGVRRLTTNEVQDLVQWRAGRRQEA